MSVTLTFGEILALCSVIIVPMLLLSYFLGGIISEMRDIRRTVHRLVNRVFGIDNSEER